MLFVALSVIVAVCNVILTKNNIKRIISKKIKFIKSISFYSIMSNFLQSSSGNITSSAIKFKPGDKKHCFDIIDNNIVIYGSVGTHDHGSSKVKLKNVVNYQWEAKDYPGHLIAVHLDGKHIAYAIKVTKSSTEGMVRVVNTYSGQRALIKGMFGEVLDLQFAFLENDQILGCIDEKTLYIHKIEMLDDNLICTLMLCIDDPIKNYQPKHDKIAWCPFLQSSISNENDIVDFSQLVVWSRGGKFQGFNLLSIIAANGIGKHNPEKLSTGYIKWEDTSLIITWITLSPDGSTLGVGSDDGYIRFYQMYFHEKQPRCLHEWKPHNGKIISSFFFLDDLTRHQTVAYWKYALTGAEGNTEFKIWDCSSWSCLQTVSFHEKSSFIAELDYTSSYLVLTNRETRGLYVLQIVKQTENKDESSDADDTQTQNDENSNDDSNLSEKSKIQSNKKTTFAFIKSVSEFPLSSPVLSFCIVDAAVRKYKCGLNDENYLIDEFDDYDEENNAIYCVVVRLVIVQPKSVQECHILYQPTLPEQCDIKSSISNESLVEGFDDYLTDISGSSSAKATNHHRHHHHNQNSSSSSSSSTQEKNTISEINTNLLLEKKRLSVSPVNITNTAIDKSQKSNSQSPIIPTVNTSSGGGHKTNPLQLNLMIPEAFSATSSAGASGGGGSGVGAVGGVVGVGGSNVNDNDKPECVSSEVLSTILMLARGTNSTTGGNKAENVNLLNFVNNKVIEDQEKRKLKQQKKNFSTVENTNSQQQQQQVGHTGADILASGGSSPSLEVQEIMSHGCKTSYYNDDKKQQKNEKNKQNVTTTNWPKVPDVRNVTKHSTEIQNTSNVVVSSTTSLEINDLSLRINQLIDLVQIQSSQINSLKNELIDLKKMKTDNRLIIGNPNDTNQTPDYSNEYLLKIEKQITKIIEQYLIRYEEEHKNRMDAYISAKNVQSQEMRDSILHYFNQFMFNEFIEKITNILITEIQRNVVPVIIDKIDVIKQQIQSDISQKLSITDNVLRENISQVCKSKSIIDAFGNSVLLGVKNGLQSAYVESMSNTLIPAYEKSSREMFKQLHGTFSSGIQEVMKQFDNYLSQLQPVEASTDEILERLSDVQKQLNHTLSKNRNTSEITTELKKDVKVMETNMLRNLSELIQKEIKKSFESQAASLEDSVLSVVRSQAHTPAPMVYDVQDQIKLLLCQNQINKAFHQALIANDLSLVEYTLEKADYKSVFNPCALEQTVLLSLIQQISADMNNHSELKQRYLSDAILNLNLNDPVTKEHSPRVLKELYKNCQYFLTNYPKNPLSSNVRMIMMAIQGMGYKVF